MDSNKDLRMDRRLLRRRNWISPEELESELASLPDVGDKLAPPEDDAPKATAESPAASPEAGMSSPESGGV